MHIFSRLPKAPPDLGTFLAVGSAVVLALDFKILDTLAEEDEQGETAQLERVTMKEAEIPGETTLSKRSRKRRRRKNRAEEQTRLFEDNDEDGSDDEAFSKGLL